MSCIQSENKQQAQTASSLIDKTHTSPFDTLSDNLSNNCL